jgi:hypothetical protein
MQTWREVREGPEADLPKGIALRAKRGDRALPSINHTAASRYHGAGRLLGV